jgi:hypothetical protein
MHTQMKGTNSSNTSYHNLAYSIGVNIASGRTLWSLANCVDIN